MSVQHPNPLWFLTCLLYFLATIFEYLFGVRLGTAMCNDLLLRLWPMPPSHFLCVALTVHFSTVCGNG